MSLSYPCLNASILDLIPPHANWRPARDFLFSAGRKETEHLSLGNESSAIYHDRNSTKTAESNLKPVKLRKNPSFLATVAGLILSLLLSWEPASVCFSQEIVRRAYLKEAERLVEAKQFDKANYLLETARQDCDAQKGNAGHEECRLEILRGFKNLYLKSDNLKKAQETIETLMPLQKASKRYNNPANASELAEDLGYILHKQGESAKAEALYRFALKIRQEEISDITPREVSVLEALALLAEGRGQTIQGAALRKQAADIRSSETLCKSFQVRNPGEPLKSFIEDMQKKIRSIWEPPKDRYERRAIVRYRILSDGTISDIKLHQTSGVPNYDQIAMQAVEKASPLSALPAPCWHYIDSEMIFDYEIYKKRKK
jgi:TonB family protein